MNTPHKKIYSLIPIITETPSIEMWKNVSCASSGIHVLIIFGALDQKVEALLSIFCHTKITLEWITTHPPPPFHHYALPTH